MYFDPLSTWLVVLIADGVNIANEKLGGNSAQAEYDRERIKQGNEWLNGDIRRVKNKYGLVLPEMAYDQIQLHIRTTRNSFVFKHTNAPIVIDLDNQEYIISVLEACAKRYSEQSPVEEYRNKAKFFKNAAVEARKRKEQYAKELEETRIKEAQEREKQQNISNVLLVLGLVIIVAFIIFFFS